LFQGINFIPAMIGLFGFSEILRNLASSKSNEHLGSAFHNAAHQARPSPRGFASSTVGLLRDAMSLLWRRKAHGARSAAVGSLVGMLPGAGVDIGSWVSMAVSKRFSKKAGEYGKGSLDGISDAVAAKSSGLAGTWVPALVFGIPGDSITAIVLGVLLMKNVTPGPDIFVNQAPLVYSVYLIFIIASLILLPIGLLAIKASGFLIRGPRRVLLPIILLFCVIGAYAINGSYFDVGMMAGMGVLGFLLERRRVPLGPVVLGIILGGPLEERFIQTLAGSDGSLSAFFSRPIAAGLGVLTLVFWLLPAFMAWRRRRPLSPA
jgi:TctA family transporter